MKPKPSDAEVLRIALEPDIELEVERVMRMSDEEIEKSLEARGYDLRELEAEADVFWAQMRKVKTHRGGYLAGAVALVSASGAAIAAAMGSFTASAVPVLVTGASPPPPVPSNDMVQQAPRDAGKP